MSTAWRISGRFGVRQHRRLAARDGSSSALELAHRTSHGTPGEECRAETEHDRHENRAAEHQIGASDGRIDSGRRNADRRRPAALGRAMVDGVHRHAFQRRRDRSALLLDRASPAASQKAAFPTHAAWLRVRATTVRRRVEHNGRRAVGQDLTLDDLQYCFGPQHRREHVRNRVALADRQPHREDVHVQHRAPDQVTDARARRRAPSASTAPGSMARGKGAPSGKPHIDHVLRSRIGQNDVRPRRTPFEQCARLRIEPAEVAHPQARARRERVQRSERSPQLRIHGGNDRAHRVLGGLDLLPPLGLGVVQECNERQQDQRQQPGNDDPEQPLLERTERDSSPQTLHVHLRVF